MASRRTLPDERRRRLAGYLSRAVRARAAGAEVSPRPPGMGPVPLSLAQQQIWVHAMMAPDAPIYNEPLTVHRAGPLDASVLERVLLEIVRRHEALRTTFAWAGDEAVQVVHDSPEEIGLRTVDLRGFPAGEREHRARRIAEHDARAPFDLERGPLWRARLVRMDDERHRLCMTIHQIVFDGVTAYRVLLPEMARLYDAFSRGAPSPLPDPPLQYGDYAVWQRRRMEDGGGAAEMEYWRERLAGPPPALDWPADRLRPAVQTHRGELCRLAMPTTFVTEVRALCARERVTPYMAMLAGFVGLLQAYTGQDDVLLGTLAPGRDRPELDGMWGYFLNPVALRLDASGDPTFREMLARVREEVLGALGHQETPFQHVVREVRRGRPDPGRNPIFQILVSLEPPPPPVETGWSLTQFDVPTGASKLDLYINLEEWPDRIAGPITYNPDLFERDTIERMVADWQTLLRHAALDPGRRLSQLAPCGLRAAAGA